MKVLITIAAVSVIFAARVSAQVSDLGTAAELGKTAVTAVSLENASELAGKAFDALKTEAAGQPVTFQAVNTDFSVVVGPNPHFPGHHGYHPGYPYPGYPYNDPWYHNPYSPGIDYPVGPSTPLSKDGQVAVSTALSIVAGAILATVLGGPVGIALGVALAIGGAYLSLRLIKGQK